METPIVYILLAAYNGRPFIREQIDSLLMQDYPSIKIVLSDDGSSDGTDQILDEYAQKFPSKILRYRSGVRFGCAQKHFMHLLGQFQNHPYIMFCDQDDVWHTDKVSKTLKAMQQLENGKQVPALVHTDLRVVDGALQEISPSFWRHSNLDGSRLALNQLLVQNVVTGCAMMINSSLAQLACKSIPDEMLMHDWWLALIASICGKSGYLSETTIDYRQHGSNSVGAKDVRSGSYLHFRLTSASMRNALKENIKQAEALLALFKERMPDQQIVLIEAFIKSQSAPLLVRDYLYVKYGLLKYGTVRKVAQLLGL